MKRSKTTIKPEDQLFIKDLTINNNEQLNAQANQVILKDFQMPEQENIEDLECEDDLQQSVQPKGHHTPPNLVYCVLPDTPVSIEVYKEPSSSPEW